MLSSSDYVLVVIETPPSPDLEASELALALAAFDIPVQVVFRGAGVFWLLAQNSRKEGGKSASKVLAAFPLYGIKHALVVGDDLNKYSLTINELIKPSKVISNINLAALIQSASHYFTF